jgi:hypothetical protein
MALFASRLYLPRKSMQVIEYLSGELRVFDDNIRLEWHWP